MNGACLASLAFAACSRSHLVVIVDTVQVVVLVMPTECAEECPHVEPGDVDAVDGDADVAENGARGVADVVEVPPRLLIVLLAAINWLGLRRAQ